MRNLHLHFIQLGEALSALRGTFELASNGKRDADDFDEFLEANEFELALHTLCDFVRENENIPVTGELLERIDELHKMMEIDDDCATWLRARLPQ